MRRGLIYQGDYGELVCQRWRTIRYKVQHIEQETHLYYLRYPVLDSNEVLLVATTPGDIFRR